MKDPTKKFTWEIRLDRSWPPFLRDVYRDGGSVCWHIWPITIYKWVTHLK